jgi:peptide chain release factor 3
VNRSEEIRRRRTFAIISHPDAGKTTITEKILYLGRVIREAGEVHGKTGTKAVTSDWMAMERERGVSITSSVMQFDYRGFRINLLDTPGHKDFGEDTYRTLIAADSAAMLIDAGKGVEERTRKLFEVCHLRSIPIYTFANKMDREGQEPLQLIDDVENTLGLNCFPVTWPIGMGDRFRGLYHRLDKKVYLFTRGEEEPKVHDVSGFDDPRIRDWAADQITYDKFYEDLDLLEGALPPWDQEAFMAGKMTPMTFGSAKYNWGVDLFLDLYAKYSPEPMPRKSNIGLVDPHASFFSGFVFKIQANMDRRHRDRVAFLRVCSGEFQRGMKVQHQRLERELRLAYANTFMARDRETVDQAFAGDIVGLIDTGNFQIGDTITDGKKLSFDEMPRFSPECFARLFIKDPLKRKQMQKAVQQLSEEGAVQIFIDPRVGEQDPIIGVVGELQFDVLLYRLNDEYGLDVRLERLPFTVARWPRYKIGEAGAPATHLPPGAKPGDAPKAIAGGGILYMDRKERPVVLVNKEWDLQWLTKENPSLEFHFTGQ